MASSGGKAAVRLAIQKEIFTPVEERLLGLAAVSKPGRKKKISYLCVSVNPQEKPPKVYISRIKQDEQRKDKQTYRKVRKWELSDLKMIDGKSADTEVPEFDLHFDKNNTFKWVASNVAEKKAFIVCLYKMVHKYLPRSKPEFVHIDEERLEELLTTAEAGGRGREIEEEAVQQEEYQELTEKEQEDLEKLLREEEEKSSGLSGIQNIESFTEHLSQQLAHLDEANIHTLMDSETQIFSLMESVEATILEIKQTETKLLVYEELLNNVRGNMTKLSKDYTRIIIWNKNLKALLHQVEEIVESLYLDPRIKRTLESTQLIGEANIRECTNAIKNLHQAMRRQLSQGVQVMQAVTDQNSLFSELALTFSSRLKEHLCKSFSHSSTLFLEAVTQRSTVTNPSVLPALPNHQHLHNELRPYTELMHWMKECENARFIEVCEAYCVEFQRVYDHEIKAFMADIKSQLGRTIDPRKGGGAMAAASGALTKFSGSQADLSFKGSTSSLTSNSPSLRGLSTSLMDFTSSFRSTTGSVTAESDRPRFDHVFMLVLDQLQPVCLAEQKFCTSFFHFQKIDNRGRDSERSSPLPPNDSDSYTEETDGLLDVFGLMKKRQNPTLIDIGVMGGGIKSILQQLFNCLLTELENLIYFGEKMDHYNSLYLLVAVTQRVMFAQEGGQLSYLDNCLASSCLVLKRLFDKLVANKEKIIREGKVPRKGGKCGILPSVREFVSFAERAERIVMGTDRRSDLDKAYETLIGALFETINRLSMEHPKTPPSVVLLENYHEVYDKLSHLKIQCLEKARDEAKQQSRAHQQQYVLASLGKPLDKLSTFFEGVERLLGSGMKPEQIGFYRDYNKAELLKCIQHYPGKEVKKGLEKLYRRCDKDLSEELGQLRVIWGAMQKAFIDQYEHFIKLIDKCYPGSNIQLEFTLEDIIEYFRSISDD